MFKEKGSIQNYLFELFIWKIIEQGHLFRGLVNFLGNNWGNTANGSHTDAWVHTAWVHSTDTWVHTTDTWVHTTDTWVHSTDTWVHSTDTAWVHTTDTAWVHSTVTAAVWSVVGGVCTCVDSTIISRAAFLTGITVVICIAITANSIVSIWDIVRAVSGSLKFNRNLAALLSVPDVAALLSSWTLIVVGAIVTEGAVVRDSWTGPVLIAYKIGTNKSLFYTKLYTY